jgi:NAD(P)-dependent dehydrogenase (short-subunit alcohol dehydrogenase family)
LPNTDKEFTASIEPKESDLKGTAYCVQRAKMKGHLMKDSRRLKNKVVVITGGCGDIGGATARKLALLGAKVVLFDIVEEKVGRARTRELRAAAYLNVDQSKTEDLQRGVADVAKRFGKIDVVIGNAGVGPGGNLLDLTDADWERVLRVNLVGCAQLAQAAVRQMLSQSYDKKTKIRGKVLFTSSWVGDFPSPGAIPYCVSKAGLNHLVRLAAQEYASRGILVNAVAPGILNAGLTKKAAFQRNAKLRQKYLGYIPLGEFGTAEQVADAFVFLCSAESDYMTGQILTVDGGCTLTKRE